MARIVKSGGAMLGLIFMALIFPSQYHVNAAVSCSQAVSKMMPCLPFLTGFGAITGPCCQGVQSLNGLANTKPVRSAICECFKKAGKSFGVNVARAKQIPHLCKIKLSIPVDPNASCANA